MSDYERGYRAGIEAAMQWHYGEAWPDSPDEAFHLKCAAAICALPVAEAADDEALAEIVAQALAETCESGRRATSFDRAAARAIVAALRDAGALR